MEPRKPSYWRSLRIGKIGGRAEAPYWLGVEVRPGSESRAKRRKGLLGSWERLLFPWWNAGKGLGRLTKALGQASAHDAKAANRMSKPRYRRPKKKGLEKDRGSLSISIVAIESWETVPRKPVSSQGGYRDTDSSLETHIGH